MQATRQRRRSRAGRVDRRRADRLRDRDPLRPGRGLRGRARAPSTTRRRGCSPADGVAGRCSARPARIRGRLPRAAHHRHRALPPRRRGAAVRGLAQQHLLAARARRRAGRRPRRGRLRPRCARCCRCCSRSPPTRRSSTAATRGCTPRAPRSSRRASRAAASRTTGAAGRPTRASSSSCCARASIIENTQMWWSVRPHLTSAPSRCASATPSPAPASPTAWRR